MHKFDNKSVTSVQATHCGKGIEVRFGKDVQTYWAIESDDPMDYTDSVQEIVEIMENTKRELEDREQMEKAAKESALQRELDRIQEELEEERRRILITMRSKRGSLAPTTPMSKRDSLRLDDSGISRELWGKEEQQLADTHVVVWKFVDDNECDRMVILSHDQDKQNPDAKTKRSLDIDTQHVFREQVSDQNKFEHDLVVDAERGDKNVKVVVEIRFDGKKGWDEGKYVYRLKVNGLPFSALFMAWKHKQSK